MHIPLWNIRLTGILDSSIKNKKEYDPKSYLRPFTGPNMQTSPYHTLCPHSNVESAHVDELHNLLHLLLAHLLTGALADLLHLLLVDNLAHTLHFLLRPLAHTVVEPRVLVQLEHLGDATLSNHPLKLVSQAPASTFSGIPKGTLDLTPFEFTLLMHQVDHPTTNALRATFHNTIRITEGGVLVANANWHFDW